MATVVFGGVDLSGPANEANTALAFFEAHGRGLRYLSHRLGANDLEIAEAAIEQSARGPLELGLDAPLSYNMGGGFRPSDAALQRLLIGRGMKPGSVMAPTMTKMSYLTLRGHAVARSLEMFLGAQKIRLVEVHPGGAFCLHGAPIEHVLGFSRMQSSRLALMQWAAGGGLVRPWLRGNGSARSRRGAVRQCRRCIRMTSRVDLDTQ